MASDKVSEIMDALHPLERKVITYLADGMLIEKLIEKSGLKEVEVIRALQWMENKKLIEKTSSLRNILELDSNGVDYLECGLPERRFLDAVKGAAAGLLFGELQKEAGLNNEEFNVCIGVLKKKAAITVENGRIRILGPGRDFLGKRSLEERFISRIADGTVEIQSLLPEEKFAYENLKKRKGIVKETLEKTTTITLTPLGKEVKSKASRTSGIEFVDRLTPEILKDSSWKNKRFRKYDIRINVPKTHGGRRHFVNQSVEYIKRVWLDMGFQEMSGPLLNTSFWNFDALFTAQDHPVRELQDTFYIKNPKYGKLPEGEIVRKVKDMHEHGGNIGSTGWGYKWKEEEARKNVLRTHTTVLSARTLARLKQSELPTKFFSVATCFRNEALDWSHLFELHQIEGIVVDPNANFRNLMGYLKEFFKKLGYDKVRIRPAYFPYTEPSAEVEVFHPVKKEWIELAGAGIFRPEVVVPLLGKDIPVLAWGMGLERSIAEYFNIKDIREIYSNDLKMLREIK